MRTFLLLLVLLGFGAYTGYAVWKVGYLGIWEAGMANVGALQVLIDVIIACTLACLWMISDARAKGLTAWPLILVTLFGGSFGPLLYLVYRERTAASWRGASLASAAR